MTPVVTRRRGPTRSAASLPLQESREHFSRAAVEDLWVLEASGEVGEHAKKRQAPPTSTTTTGEDRSPSIAVHRADTNERAYHTVPAKPTLRSPEGVRHTDSKFAAKTIIHSTLISTAMPAW
jgi:hypothetical protein